MTGAVQTVDALSPVSNAWRAERHRQRVENFQLVVAFGAPRLVEATYHDLAAELARCADFGCAPDSHDAASGMTATPVAPAGLRAMFGLFGRLRDALS